MIPALSFEDLKYEIKKRYNSIHKQIVGIIYARYDISLVKSLIESSYKFWNEDSGDDFSIFWIGYGRYIFKENENIKCLKGGCEDKGIHFDISRFIEFKNKLESDYKIEYIDNFELLLVECEYGEINLQNYLRINLEVEEQHIRSLIQKIIFCAKNNYQLDQTENILKANFSNLRFQKRFIND
jgi:hypothetical protein